MYIEPKMSLLFLANHSGRWISKLSRRSTLCRAATEVSGQRQRLRASTATSTNTTITSQPAVRYSPRQETHGIARMQPAINAQTIVCTALIPLKVAESPSTSSRSWRTSGLTRKLITQTGDKPSPVGLAPFGPHPRHLSGERHGHAAVRLVVRHPAFPRQHHDVLADHGPAPLGMERFNQIVFIESEQQGHLVVSVSQRGHGGSVVHAFPLDFLARQQSRRIPGGFCKEAHEFALS